MTDVLLHALIQHSHSDDSTLPPLMCAPSPITKRIFYTRFFI
ncbi:hypothetical protein HMPREF3232_01209 [Fannyhessea vaginae]|nr:hypothetical protein HMPREF3232_01209 [Fannyhessea vaginae]